MSNSTDSLAQSKLIILYLLRRMNMPVSLAHIQRFALSAEYMDYFSLTTYLAEMTGGKQIIKTKENNQTCYSITSTGLQSLSYFENMLSEQIRNNISDYVSTYKPHLKDDLEVRAVYKEISENNYNVNLSLVENSESLIEINLASLSKDYAKNICANWKNDTSNLYLSTLKNLLGEITE